MLVAWILRGLAWSLAWFKGLIDIKEHLDRIEGKVDKMAGELDNLKREVEETQAKTQEIIDALAAIKTQLTQVQQQLAEAIAASDPAAIQAAADALNEVQTKIDAALGG